MEDVYLVSVVDSSYASSFVGDKSLAASRPRIAAATKSDAGFAK